MVRTHCTHPPTPQKKYKKQNKNKEPLDQSIVVVHVENTAKIAQSSGEHMKDCAERSFIYKYPG